MRGMRAAVAGALLALALIASILRFVGVEFSAGSFYPEYSSLRADPHGAKLLFESLSRLPGLQTSRNYLPLEYSNVSQSTVLLLGIPLAALNPTLFGPVERLARRGNRVVVALAFQEADQKLDPGALKTAWHVQWKIDDPKRPHPLSFTDPGDWQIREQAGSRILAIERTFGAGTVWLSAESAMFSNETLVAGSLDIAIRAIGPRTRVVFDEQHFGIAESGSVIALARRFRLTGLAFGLAIVAALALWKNTSSFPPRRQIEASGDQTGRTSFEGLVTLLQRHLKPQQLAQTCWEEWLKANRHQVAPDRLRDGAALAGNGARHPLETVRQLHTALRAKGEL